VGKDDEQGFADALVALLSDADGARAMGRAGREHVLSSFGVERLVADHEALYRELLTRRRGGTAAA
jgi:glycosyltransferase involved in cell wall biosynthesis